MFAEHVHSRILELVERSDFVLGQWELITVNSFDDVELDWASFGRFVVAALQASMVLAGLDETMLSPSMLADLLRWPSAYEEVGAS